MACCFKTHRRHYYELLDTIRETGDWEAWLDFCAESVIVTATQAMETAQQLVALSSQNRDRIGTLGRAAPSALQIHRVLMKQPIAPSNWHESGDGIAGAMIGRTR